ncbi:hypothetical protein SLS53_000607 [Cytospora paraplurivora]|uniref:Uncharacterized protein n=1 Tax=Cytospora paraplurivora TaxID=2898453 RepID=A0AAN9UKH7_9PEZI
MAHLYFTNKLDEPNGRSGKPVKFGYAAPPGVSDRFWYRLLHVANTQVYREVQGGQHIGKTKQKLHALKYRKALLRLTQSLGEARSEEDIKAKKQTKKQTKEQAKKQAEEEAKQAALYHTRPNLGEDFYVWMVEHGYLIDTATWEWEYTD